MATTHINDSNPARQAEAIVNDAAFTRTARAIYVGAPGNISVRLPDNSDVVFAGAVAGSVLPVNCVRVNASGTTATNLVALF